MRLGIRQLFRQRFAFQRLITFTRASGAFN
jgi:hypothetical protein